MVLTTNAQLLRCENHYAQSSLIIPTRYAYKESTCYQRHSVYHVNKRTNRSLARKQQQILPEDRMLLATLQMQHNGRAAEK